jgi:hypothetical protein
MSRERVTADELLEAAKAARDLKYEIDALANSAKEEALEQKVSYDELVRQEAMALGELMLRLSKLFQLKRVLGNQAIGVQRLKDKKLYDYNLKYLTTPTLLQAEEELDGESIMQGWRFQTRAAKDRDNKLKPWKVLSVEIIDHREVLDSDLEPEEEVKRLIRLQAGNKGGEIIPIPYFVMGDPNDPELLDIYALLNIARQELGDKKAK